MNKSFRYPFLWEYSWKSINKQIGTVKIKAHILRNCWKICFCCIDFHVYCLCIATIVNLLHLSVVRIAFWVILKHLTILHFHSIKYFSCQETYLSADDLRINLWHMEITDQSFNIVDIKPANMEELTEVITASEFHPKECNLFVYSSSKGTIRLCDMRQVGLHPLSKIDVPVFPSN